MHTTTVESLTASARHAAELAHPDAKGRRVGHATGEAPDGRAVACACMLSPARFGTVRMQFVYRLAGRVIPRADLADVMHKRERVTNDQLRKQFERHALVIGMDAAVQWYEKACEKLGPLEDASVTFDAEGGCIVSGWRERREIVMMQQRVFKASKNGKDFTQYPARIYVNGEYTPDAIYQALFA